MHMEAMYKAMDCNRQHIYDKLEYTRQSTERQNKSMLSRSFDFLDCMEERCREKGIEIANMSTSQKATVLEEVFAEYNGFGTIATNAKYQLGKGERCGLANLILHVADATKRSMQNFLSQVKEAMSPYRAELIGSKRWLVNGRPSRRAEQSTRWDELLTMTREKTTLLH